MNIANVLTEFEKIFSESEMNLVMQALVQDALIFKSINNEKYFHQAINELGSNIDKWTPAELSLLALNDNFGPLDSFTDGRKISDTVLSHHSLEKLESTLKNEEPPGKLIDAGLLAFALLSRYEINPSWQDLWKEMDFADSGIDWKFYQVWRTPLACLFGWVKQPLELLKSLNRESNHLASYFLISHILLCYASEKEEQITLLKELMDDFEEMDRISLLRSIHFSGRRDLVSSFAKSIGAESGKRFEMEKYSPERSISFVNIENILATANLNIFAGEKSNGIELLDLAAEFFQDLLSGVRLQIIEQDIHDENDQRTLEEVEKLNGLFPKVENVSTELVMAVSGKPILENVLREFRFDTADPFMRFQQAIFLFDEGRIPEAKPVAVNAVKDFINLSVESCMRLLPNYVLTWKPEEMIDLLRKLDLRQEAIVMAEFLLAKYPMQSRLLEKLSSLYYESGDHAKALENIQTYLVLEPIDTAGLELGAKLWKHYGEDERAHKHYQRYLNVKVEPTLYDWFEYAKYSERVCDYKEVLDACSEVLKRSSHHAEASILQGIAALKLGDTKLAIASLSMATLLSPESPESWFYLAEAHRKKGDEEKTLEILQSGVNYEPESAKLNLALAQAYLASDLISEGLNYLEACIDCEPGSVATVLELGEVLHSRQMLEEELALYKKAYSKWPDNKYLATAHAELLFSYDDFENAQRIMNNIVDKGNPEINDLLLCIKAMLRNRSPILSDHKKISREVLSKAKGLVEDALAVDPENLEAMLLSGEILAVTGELESSSRIFRELLEKTQSNNSEYCWRMQAGFGFVALQQNKVEAALASLREAVSEQPEDNYLNRLLAETYAKADLRDEAIRVSKYAVEIAPDDIDTLLWYAEISLRLGYSKIAHETLLTASRLCPDNIEILQRLADLQIQAGLLEDARHSLEVLLQMNDQNYEHLLQLGLLLIKIENFDSAEKCLERALSSNQDPSVDLLMMLSVLSSMKSDFDTAFEYSQRSLAVTDDPLLYIFQSDLLMAMNKPKSAFTVLKYALELQEDTKDASERVNLDILSEILPSDWFEYMKPAGIFLRLSYASWKGGKLKEGLGFAHQALDLMPESNVVRFMATGFAWMLGDMDLVKTVLDSSSSLEIHDKSSEFMRKAVIALMAFQLDLAFESGDDVLIGKLIDQFNMIDSSSSRLMAAESRRFAKEGDVIKADEFFKKAREEYQNKKKGIGSQSNGFTIGFDIVSDLYDSIGDWLAKAALDSFNWQDALDIYEGLINNNPAAIWFEFEYAKAIIICAEHQRFFTELKIYKHAPGDWILAKEYHRRFLKTISGISQFSGAYEIKRWKARGEMAFLLNQQTVKAFGNLAKFPDDLPILLTSLRQIENSKTAIDILKRITEPLDEPAHLVLCYRYVNPRKSIELAQQAIEARPNDPIVYAVLGDLANSANDTFVALQSYSAALRIWDDEHAWHAEAGRLAQKAGYVADMIHYLEQSYSLYPENIDYAMALGKVYFDQKKYEDAIRVFRKATEQNPEKMEIWLVLADALAKDGQTESAFDCADRAKEAGGKSPQPLLLLGNLSAQIGEYEAALGYARKALVLKPDNDEVIIFLSRILVEIGEIQKALDIIDQFSPNNGKSNEILIEHARLKKIAEDSSGALTKLKDVLEKEPDNIDALSMLSEILADCGDVNGSEKYAQKVLRLQPGNAFVNRILGKIKRDTGQLDQAIHYYCEAIREDPGVMESYLDIAETYQSRREKDEALDAYQKAIDVFPGDYRPYYSAGLFLRGEKDYIEAEKMLRKAAELSPDDIFIQRQLGSVVAINLVHNAQEAKYRI